MNPKFSSVFIAGNLGGGFMCQADSRNQNPSSGLRQTQTGGTRPEGGHPILAMQACAHSLPGSQNT